MAVAAVSWQPNTNTHRVPIQVWIVCQECVPISTRAKPVRATSVE